jgi:hypothetical protein
MSDGTDDELIAREVFLGADDGKSANFCHGKSFAWSICGDGKCRI